LIYDFFTYRREKRRGGARENKERAMHSTGQIVIYLVRVLPGRDLSACGHAQREKEYSFCKQGEITPLLQKTIQEIEKRKVKHNTQKIINI